MLSVPQILQPWMLYAVAAVFAIGTLVNLIGPGPIREEYARWGYPAGFRFVTAGLEAVALALILLPMTRVTGLLLGIAIMVGAIATLIRAGQYGHIVPAALVLAVSLLLI